jgi:hypothetical protein
MALRQAYFGFDLKIGTQAITRQEGGFEGFTLRKSLIYNNLTYSLAWELRSELFQKRG